MARQVSALTLAIRALCESTKGEITNADARPLLAKQGIAIAVEPGAASQDYTDFKDMAVKITKNPKLRDVQMQDENLQAKVLNKLELSAARLKAVQNEISVRALYAAEANNFNVVKSNWKNAGSPSVKPTGKATGRAAAAAKHGKTVEPVVKRGRGRPAGSKNKVLVVEKRGPGRPKSVAAVVVAPGSVMTEVVKLGGASAIAQQVAAKKAEITQLESLLTGFNDLKSQIEQAAA